MSSNFYTNSYLRNHQQAKAERNKEREKILEIQSLLPEILKELKETVYRLDNIEKAIGK